VHWWQARSPSWRGTLQSITAAVIRFLQVTRGTSWTVASRPDETNPNSPSPDRIVTDGSTSIALEIKTLMSQMGKQLSVIDSLARRLAPSCGGTYNLDLGESQIDELDKKDVAQLKKAIEQVAASLQADEEAFLPLPRRAAAVHQTGGTCDAWPRLSCSHGPLSDYSAESAFGGPGCLMLVDSQQRAHSFRSPESEPRFRAQMEDVARQMAAGTTTGGAEVEWFEEAVLTCVSRDDDEGVNVLNALVSHAEHTDDHARYEIQAVIPGAVRKFERPQSWADENWIALGTSLDSREDVALAIDGLDRSELKDVAAIILVNRDEVHLVYQAERA
jgi:hypothetical protein